jgi:hypothetical protein
MQETAVPGLSMAIINEARVASRRTFGVIDVASGKPVHVDTMFEAAYAAVCFATAASIECGAAERHVRWAARAKSG